MKKAIRYSSKHQAFIPEGEILPHLEKNWQEVAEVLVAKKRTLEVAKAYTGQKTCILNFANAEIPGGK